MIPKKKTTSGKWRKLAFVFVVVGWILTQWMTHFLWVHQEGAQAASLPSIDLTNSSSACLLVMDDNHRLVEWLAYHHYTLNLRYLVVAVDPRSSTSPKTLLDRWKPLGLQYEIWTDGDYMGSRVFDKRQRLFELKRKQLTMVHRVRQKAFYQFCLERLGSIQAGWTLLVDVDEYYVVAQDRVENAKEITSQPGGIYNYIQKAVKQAKEEQFTSPCISFPRLLFGAEEHSQDSSSTSLPQIPNNIYLDTTRWFYHAYFSEFDRNGNAKTMVDLNRIHLHFKHAVNPHRPFQDFCKDPKYTKEIHKNALLRVHHYLSTWETYSFRNDSRKGAERSREAWEYRAFGNQVGPNMDIVPWLQGFVDHHGKETAVQLLQGAGLPPSYTHPPAVEGEWKFEFWQEFLDQNNAQQFQSKYGKFLQNKTARTGG